MRSRAVSTAMSVVICTLGRLVVVMTLRSGPGVAVELGGAGTSTTVGSGNAAGPRVGQTRAGGGDAQERSRQAPSTNGRVAAFIGDETRGRSPASRSRSRRARPRR